MAGAVAAIVAHIVGAPDMDGSGMDQAAGNIPTEQSPTQLPTLSHARQLQLFPVAAQAETSQELAFQIQCLLDLYNLEKS